MKKVCVIGHFGKGKKLLNGQTIKTKILTEELIRNYGEENVVTIDTHGGAKAIFRMFFEIAGAMRECENIVILPAHNGVKIIPRIIEFWNFFYKRKIHYDVVGGWLPNTLESMPRLIKMFSNYTGIYVEVDSMKCKLNELGLKNVFVIPNCKNLEIIQCDELSTLSAVPIKLCTFSRVMKEKGIEEAVRVIEALNRECNTVRYELDIYGQIDPNQTEWFNNLISSVSSGIRYCGLVDYNKSTDVLKNYHALLFPTFYSGEGFAGTIIDAMAAGVPVIASDWKYNSEVIVDGYNGMLFETHNVEALKRILYSVDFTSEEYMFMKKNCVLSATKYLPSVALRPLLERIYTDGGINL